MRAGNEKAVPGATGSTEAKLHAALWEYVYGDTIIGIEPHCLPDGSSERGEWWCRKCRLAVALMEMIERSES